MSKEQMSVEHDHDHEHDMFELSDDELGSVSGGVGRSTTCPCQRHQLPTKETM